VRESDEGEVGETGDREARSQMTRIPKRSGEEIERVGDREVKEWQGKDEI